jgi:hypothetical protein
MKINTKIRKLQQVVEMYSQLQIVEKHHCCIIETDAMGNTLIITGSYCQYQYLKGSKSPTVNVQTE